MINENEGERCYKIGGTNNASLVAEGACRHPFVDDIIDTSFSKQWKAITLDCYGDNTYPNEHIVVNITQQSLHSIDDAIICKAFPITLKGPALEWFTRLSPYSIDCFDTLTSFFTMQFTTSQHHFLTSLRTFIDRFRK